jgi:hypothetical protein
VTQVQVQVQVQVQSRYRFTCSFSPASSVSSAAVQLSASAQQKSAQTQFQPAVQCQLRRSRRFKQRDYPLRAGHPALASTDSCAPGQRSRLRARFRLTCTAHVPFRTVPGFTGPTAVAPQKLFLLEFQAGCVLLAICAVALRALLGLLSACEL